MYSVALSLVANILNPSNKVQLRATDAAVLCDRILFCSRFEQSANVWRWLLLFQVVPNVPFNVGRKAAFRYE